LRDRQEEELRIPIYDRVRAAKEGRHPVALQFVATLGSSAGDAWPHAPLRFQRCVRSVDQTESGRVSRAWPKRGYNPQGDETLPLPGAAL